MQYSLNFSLTKNQKLAYAMQLVYVCAIQYCRQTDPSNPLEFGCQIVGKRIEEKRSGLESKNQQQQRLFTFTAGQQPTGGVSYWFHVKVGLCQFQKDTNWTLIKRKFYYEALQKTIPDQLRPFWLVMHRQQPRVNFQRRELDKTRSIDSFPTYEEREGFHHKVLF